MAVSKVAARRRISPRRSSAAIWALAFFPLRLQSRVLQRLELEGLHRARHFADLVATAEARQDDIELARAQFDHRRGHGAQRPRHGPSQQIGERSNAKRDDHYCDLHAPGRVVTRGSVRVFLTGANSFDRFMKRSDLRIDLRVGIGYRLPFECHLISCIHPGKKIALIGGEFLGDVLLRLGAG